MNFRKTGYRSGLREERFAQQLEAQNQQNARLTQQLEEQTRRDQGIATQLELHDCRAVNEIKRATLAKPCTSSSRRTT